MSTLYHFCHFPYYLKTQNLFCFSVPASTKSSSRKLASASLGILKGVGLMPNLLSLLGAFDIHEDIPSHISSLLLKLLYRTGFCHGPQFLITSAFFHLDLHHPAAAPLVPNTSLHAESPGLVNSADYNIQKHKSLKKLLPLNKQGLKKHSVCWEMRNKLS